MRIPSEWGPIPVTCAVAGALVPPTDTGCSLAVECEWKPAKQSTPWAQLSSSQLSSPHSLSSSLFPGVTRWTVCYTQEDKVLVTNGHIRITLL